MPKQQLAGIDIAQSAIEFIATYPFTLSLACPELVEGRRVLVRYQLRSSRSPASCHRAFASANFLKTHAIAVIEI